MYKINGKYGNVHVNGMSIDIDKIDIIELEEFLQQLEKKQEELVRQQNDYLSKIIEYKE